jgi:hypothetical protein
MKQDRFVPVAPHWYATNLGGVIATGILAALTRNRFLRRVFWGAVAVHVAEAAYTYRAAREAGFTESAPKWTLQTLAVGFPSLFALRDARAAAEEGDQPASSGQSDSAVPAR